MEFVIGGLAASAAAILTNPLEVVKHQMEISKKSQFTNRYQSFFYTGFKVARNKGIKSLQKGLSPAVGAHLVSYGMKLGTYQYAVNKALTKDDSGQTIILNSVGISIVGGLLGQYLSNPFYVVKADHYAVEEKKKNGTYTDTAKRILREHGIRGFFRGATTCFPRAMLGTSQLTSFAVTKEALSNYDLFAKNPVYASTVAGIVAGALLSIIMTPFETVLNSMYQQAIRINTQNAYKGYIDCIIKIYKTNGFKPFYRGMGPIYLKMGPHTALCLVFWEELKNAYYKEDTEYNSTPNPNKLDLYTTLGFDVRSNFNHMRQKHEDNATILYM